MNSYLRTAVFGVTLGLCLNSPSTVVAGDPVVPLVYNLGRPQSAPVREEVAEWYGRTWPVTLCESGARPEARRTTNVGGVDYLVLGLYQILWDGATSKLAERLGYKQADLLDPAANITMAYEWAMLTDRGIPMRQWVCKLRMP